MNIPHLWGKDPRELQAERNKMIARREFLAQRDAEAKTPQALGRYYAGMQQQGDPVQRGYHFGTDIPRPTWREVEDARERTGRDDAGHSGTIVFLALLALPLLFAAGVLYLALQ